MINYLFRNITVAAVVSTFALIVVGGLVRLTGSGLGCPDWPLCHGRFVPPADWQAWVEFSHRLSATLASIFIVAALVYAWWRYRDHQWIFRSTLAAVILLVVQILLGAITVLFELPPLIVAAHLSNALLIFAALLVAATFALRPANQDADLSASAQKYRRLVLASLIGTFILVVSGTFVTGTNAGYACTTWPLCNDQLIPDKPLPQLAWIHRLAALAIGLHILFTFNVTRQTQRHFPTLVRAAGIAVVLLIAQSVVGAWNALEKFPLWLNLAHLAFAAAFWGAMVVFATLAYQGARSANPNV